MVASGLSRKGRAVVFMSATILVALVLYIYVSVLGEHLTAGLHTNLLKIPVLALSALLAYLGVRALNVALFDFVFRLRRGYEAPTLVRNIFTLIAFTILFVLIFKWQFTDINLGALFTTSAIFGVII